MSKCVNDNCNKDPLDNELEMVLATPDADYACCKACLEEFKKQRDEFFDNVHYDAWYKNWLGL